jgi:hypothetical protein
MKPEVEVMLREMRVITPAVYDDRWSEDGPVDGDVCVHFTTNGEGSSTTGQVNIYIWPHETGWAPPETPHWVKVRAEIADTFERAGWCVKTNSWGVATWRYGS